jgi:hypothetical protein
MDAIFDRPRAKRDELPLFRSACFAWVFSASLFLLIGASSPAEAGKPADKASAQPSGGTTQILPARLGLPNGCSSSEGSGMNDGSLASGQLVVVGHGNCSGATRPVRWQNGQWANVFSYPTSGIANDASNDSPGQPGKATVSGFVFGKDYFEFAQRPGSVPMRLPRLEGTAVVACQRLRLSSSGNHITGCTNGPNHNEFQGVRWTWNDSTGWRVGSLGLNYYPVAISDDGSVVVGNRDEQVKLWLALPGGGSESVVVGNGFAEDINFSPDKGLTIVVGYRKKACTGSCAWYPVPVYWKETESGWVRRDLKALDGVDSSAVAVNAVDGKLIIVGWGFTRRDGIQRAVAWIPESSGDYGQPVRLGAIDGRSKMWARAVDINKNGVVLGYSQVPGLSGEAVLWMLPK